MMHAIEKRRSGACRKSAKGMETAEEQRMEGEYETLNGNRQCRWR